MAGEQSLTSRFDELWKTTNILNQSPLEEFLRFATSQEECRLKWLESVKENQRLKRLIDETKKENINLEGKIASARKILDQERRDRLHSEVERNKLERQLQMVRNLLFTDNRNHLHDETREKLKFLDSSVRSRISLDCNDRLCAIQELDSTGSILSDLSYSRSDDDLDVVSMLRRKRAYKPHRPSVGCDQPASVKRRRSQVFEINGKDGGAERMVATTTVTMEQDGVLSARSQIETVPSGVDPLLSTKKCGSMESVESELSIENNPGYNQGTPQGVGVLPISSTKISLSTNHAFVSKTMIRPEECDVCDKKIKFGNTVLRCQNCRASCHPMCKDSLPLPCVEPGSTPMSKKYMGVVADYAPTKPPLVPALVVHCINEIEAHGLNESGIYRIPGSDKEVRALKEKFMRCRGVPRLANIDPHVICGCLKDFLRTLKEPLVTFGLWWGFAEAADIPDLDERRSKLYQAISQLPAANRDTLSYLILHLLRVAESKETNKMNISNLATVLGPTVVGYPEDYNPMETYAITSKAKLVLEQLMSISAEYWYRLLTMSGSAASTPHIMESADPFRTPSSRRLKKLFETPR